MIHVYEGRQRWALTERGVQSLCENIRNGKFLAKKLVRITFGKNQNAP